MYEYDPIVGTIIDILSTAPFSPFELTGLPDQKMLNVYAENIDAMDITSLSPEIAKQYMIDGTYIGTINENKELNVFTGIMPIDMGACQFTYLPWSTNRDPIIDVTINQNIKNLIKSKDPRIQDELARYGGSLTEMVKKGSFPLDPRMTIYFPRRTLASYNHGTSALKRLIPVHLYEKALLRGTIDLSYRRQKSILHLMIGDDEYLPTEAQLGQYAKLFADADADPLGAVVATRPQVQTNEIRNGSDFWKIDETNEFLTQQKMRGLGVSEALLGSDTATVDTTAQTMTIFLDNLRGFRETYTRKIYYQNILLNIAIKHGFERKETRESVTGVDIDEKHIKNMYGDEVGELVIEQKRSRLIAGNNNIVQAEDGKHYRLSDYHLPKIGYHKALKPEGNQELLTNLATLQQQGLPIPLRIWAVASGVSIAEITRMLPEDVKQRKIFQKAKSEWPVDPTQQANQLLQSSLIEAGIIPGRKCFELPEYRMKDPDTKKILSRKGQAVREEKLHKTIVEASMRVNGAYNRRIKAQHKPNSKYHYGKSPMYGLIETKVPTLEYQQG